MLSFKLLDVIQIIAKDITFYETNAFDKRISITQWFCELHGKVGYVDPSDVKIVQPCEIIYP